MYTFTIENMNETEILNAMISAYDKNEGEFAIKLSDDETAFIRAFNYEPNHKDCEWFFVSGIEDPWACNDSLEKLAAYFADYANRKADLAADKIELAKLEDKLRNIADKKSEEYSELYSWYSDWHKDLYGRRPRNII